MSKLKLAKDIVDMVNEQTNDYDAVEAVISLLKDVDLYGPLLSEKNDNG